MDKENYLDQNQNKIIKRKKQFTKEQQYVVKKCISDVSLFGFSDKETMKYIEDKTGRPISLTTLQRYKKQVRDEDETGRFMNSYANKGFFDYFCNRIREIEFVQHINLKMIHDEMDKPENERDKHLIVKLSNTVRENNNHLVQLGMCSPIIAQVRSYINELEDKIGVQKNNNTSNNWQSKALYEHSSGEDDNRIDEIDNDPEAVF